MLSQQQQQQQQMTVVVDAGTLATDDVTSGREPAAAAAAAAAAAGACNHRAPPPPPIITRTVATPLATPRGSSAAAAAATATGDDVIGDVMTRAASSESFVTSLAGYSDTHIYDAADPVRRCRPRALINYLLAQRRFRFTIRPACPKALSCVAGFVRYTQREVTSQSLWSRYDRHFVGKTRRNALS